MPSVTFSVSVEESHAILKKVLPLMSQQQVPTIPQNYAVWYDFVCAADARLVAEVQERITQGLEFPPETCESLYQRYFLAELRGQVDGIQDVMRSTVDTLVGDVSSLGQGLDGFVGVLEDAGASLQGTPAPEQLDALLGRLVQETLATRQRSATMQASLQAMAETLAALRVQVDALTRDSQTDALTGVATRRAFDDGLNRMIREVDANAGELCLLLAEVDRFELFKERQAPEVADQVLRFVAQELDECVKGRDLLARYQGEVFAILLPATSYNGALMLAESIRAIIEAQLVETDHGDSIGELTVSIGVSQYRREEHPSDFVERAAAGLAQSRDQGRNRVTAERDLQLR